MALSKLPSLEMQVLLGSHGNLCEAFQSQENDLTVLCKELEKYYLIDKRAAQAFHSLDQDKMDSGIKARYLLQYIFKAIKHNPSLLESFLSVLSNMKMESIRRKLTDLKDELSGSDKLLERDLPILTDIIGTRCGAKWENIGIMLNLPKALLDSIGSDGSGVKVKLHRVLSEWLTGKYRPATITQLKEVLENEFIAEKCLAASLKGRFEEAYSEHPSKKQKLECEPHFQVLYQSSNIVINDGKAAIIEVQTTSNETASFLWMKDGLTLSDGELYNGVDSNMLVVFRACEATKGKYTCQINGEQTVTEIELSVEYSRDKKYLVSKYSSPLTKLSNDSWPTPATTKFIRLALLKKEGHPSTYFVPSNIDAILQKKSKIKTTISFEEAFGLYQPGSLIFVEGRPGSGKTTLACKIARDWATQSSTIRYADYVFLLSLRGYQGKEIMTNKFRSFLELAEETDGEGFCFIFDGLDEWQNTEDELDCIIDLLIQKQYLEQAMIIVMSRPAATSIYRNSATKIIEIIGFTATEVYEYVDMYPFDQVCKSEDCKDKPSNLKKYLNEHRNVLHMCYLPVHAAMICFLYGLSEDMPETETQMYEHFTKSIILRQLQRKNLHIQLKSLDHLDEKNGSHFRKISELAFRMTCSREQVVESCQSFPLDSVHPPNSLLTIDVVAQIYGFDNIITFLHLTLQEYLAARHIASLPMMEQLEIIQEYGTHEHMLTTWKFFCGINSNQEGKTFLFEELIKRIKSNHLYKMECAYESQNPTLCTKLIQVESCELCLSYLSLTPSNLTAICYVLMESCTCPSRLDIRICASNVIDQDSIQQNEILESLNSIASSPSLDLEGMISSITSNFPDFIKLYYGLPQNEREKFHHMGRSFLRSLTQKDIYKTGMNVFSVTNHILGNFLKRSSNILTSDNSKPLIEALHHCAPHLCILNIDSNIIGPQGAAVLSTALKHCSSLHSLNIATNLIGLEGVKSLADGLQHCKLLYFLNVGSNNIDSEGEEILAATTINLPELKKINISFNVMDKLALADHSRLLELNLSGTITGSVLKEGSLRFPPELEQLELSYNNMDSRDALEVATALRSCTKLKHLVLSHNKIQYEGALQIIDSIQNRVQELDFSSNVIGKKEQLCLLGKYSHIKMDFSQNSEPEDKETTSPYNAKEISTHMQELLQNFSRLLK